MIISAQDSPPMYAGETLDEDEVGKAAVYTWLPRRRGRVLPGCRGGCERAPDHY